MAAAWNPKARQWIRGRKEQKKNLADKLKQIQNAVIWMHCASLGEFEQGRPVFESLLDTFPNYQGVITFFSPSGYIPAINYKRATHIFYLPFTNRMNKRRFVDALNPSLVLWVKYDYWQFYLSYLSSRKIPLLLISATFQRSQAFFKWYGKQHKKILQCFSHLFVQTEESKRLLKKIGIIEEVTVNGDTRFDRVLEIASRHNNIPAVEEFCAGSQVIVAGSTWIDDEQELDHYANSNPQRSFIIAPHDTASYRISEVQRLFTRSIRFSEYEKQRAQPGFNAKAFRSKYNTLIIDNIGMLSRLYKYASIAYVGGGFGNDGVHNVLEAAVYGKPVIFGPVFSKYMEAIELLEEGGAFTVETALELELKFNELFQNPELLRESGIQAEKYVFRKKGATEKIVRYVQEKRLLTS